MDKFAGRSRRRVRSGRWCLCAVALAAVALAGCATGGAKGQGQQAERLEDWDQAVVEYSAAVRENPQDKNARLDLERAKLRATQIHVANGRRLASVGKVDEALVEYQIASQLSPASTEIEDALRSLKTALRARVAVAQDGKTQLQSLIERTRDLPPLGPRSARRREDARFARLPRRQFARRVHGAGALRGCQRRLRPGVPRRPAHHRLAQFDAGAGAGLAWRQARGTSTASRRRARSRSCPTPRPSGGSTRRKWSAPSTCRTRTSRRRSTCSASSSTPGESPRSPAPTRSRSRTRPERVAAAGKLIAAIDKARPEVVIDVEVMEVDRGRLKEYGLQIASPGSPGIDGAVAINRPAG